jgi:nucleoside-diphosphate-sugar epimerase
MKIVVTGATGFVGRHVVQAARARGHSVIALARDVAAAGRLPWLREVSLVQADMYSPPASWPEQVRTADAAIHLAWTGLPNYRSLVHVEEYLPQQIAFLKALAASGARRLLITGTCLEYGMKEGELDETLTPAPAVPYAAAKNVLRQYLEDWCAQQGVALRWTRLFYMHGEGQNPKSLLAQLDRAIDAGDKLFNMSGGEQLRDYLPVTQVAQHLVALAEHASFAGTVNVCSGAPISVRRLVEQHIAARGASIGLNLGHYPYLDYEPRAFWGSARKLASLEAAS